MINTIIWNFFGNDNNVIEPCNILHKNNIINIKYSFGIKEFEHFDKNIKHITFDSLFQQEVIKSKYDHNQEDNEFLNNIADNIQGRTICALGDAAAMPVRAMIEHFHDEFEYHIEHKKCMV